MEVIGLRNTPSKTMMAGDRFLVDFAGDCLHAARKICLDVHPTTEFEVLAVGILRYGKTNTVVRIVVLRTRPVGGEYSQPYTMDAFPVINSPVCCCLCYCR